MPVIRSSVGFNKLNTPIWAAKRANGDVESEVAALHCIAYANTDWSTHHSIPTISGTGGALALRRTLTKSRTCHLEARQSAPVPACVLAGVEEKSHIHRLSV